MKTINKFLSLLIIASSINANAAGGPDAYGYTWLDSNDPGGPMYNWVDISTIGTEITGLADDNSVPVIDMGLSFGFYWSDYSEVTIGSNGWLGFNDFGNLRACFDDIPTEGGRADNFVAPFLTDLNFAGENNLGKAYYYHDAVNNEFIISFVDVPYYEDNADGYMGSNTFQVIFSAEDSSITFQYQDIDQENYEADQNCPSTLLIGMENTNGNIGLETHYDMLPADNSAVKFYYPDVPLIEVIDVAPIWSQNSKNTATQYEANQDIDLIINVANLGNTDALLPIDVMLDVLDEEGNTVYSDMLQINPLLAQQDQTFNLATALNVDAGRYQLLITSDSMDDSIISNNSLSTEINVIDTSMTPVVLGHTTGSLTNVSPYPNYATYFETPEGNWMINSVSMFVRDTLSSVSEDNRFLIYANDAGNNLPGSLLASELVVDAINGSFRWVNTELAQPIMAPTNGFFVAWEKVNDTSSGIGLQSFLPLSRLTYTYSNDGGWAIAQENHLFDLAIEVELTDNLLDTIFTNGFE